MFSQPAPDALIALALCSGLLLFASLHDIVARTIPDTVPLVLAGAGVFLRVSDHSLLTGVAGALAVFGGCAFCWRRGWIGGGDAKLLTVAALLVPPGHVPEMIVATALAGGLLALAYLALSRIMPDRPKALRPRGLPMRAMRAEIWRIRRRGPLPYACAIAAGTLLTMLKS